MTVLQPMGFGGAGLRDQEPDIVRDYLVAGVAVTEGDLCSFLAVTDDTVEQTVEQTDVSDALPNLIAGVCRHAAAIGEYVQVVKMGPALVNVGDATITALQVAGLHATADGCADNADATEGSFGVFLSANDVGGTNKAWVDVRLAARAADA